jgi:hypothetical protein
MNKKIYITESQFNIFVNEQMSNEEIDKRTKDINENPTDAQKKASNYKMAHVYFSGFKITIENAKGSKRYWKDEKGNTGYNLMKNHYGYFSKSLGHDGDHVDVFLGDNQESDKVYIVDQNFKDGSFDESKVMLGFNSKKDAKEAYLSNFSKDWKGFGKITGVTKKMFKKWLYNGRKQQKPFSEYVEVIKKQLKESKDMSIKGIYANPISDEPFELLPDFTPEEKLAQKEKEKRAEAAKKAAETRKRNKELKQKEEEEKFYQKQREMGWRDLFGQ